MTSLEVAILLNRDKFALGAAALLAIAGAVLVGKRRG